MGKAGSDGTGQRLSRRAPLLALGAAALFLAACDATPFMAGPRILPAPAPAPTAPSQEVDTFGDFGATGTMSEGAEQACIAAGRERGLQVMGVAGSRAVTTSEGAPAQDVMLRVSRDGAQIEVRCNYVAETGMARIMLI